MTQLDDWVLCRIYKKNSSSQKSMIPSASSKEYCYSNGSSSSSSSHLDDVLESLPEIDDRYFSLPRVNSLKTLQQEDKLNFPNLGAGNLVDWSNPAGLNSVPEFVSGNQSQAMPNYNPGNDLYVPSMPSLCHVDSAAPPEKLGNAMEEEVQSGVTTQRIENSSGFFHQNPDVFTSQGFSNSLDPYGFRYPTQSVGFGLRQ